MIKKLEKKYLKLEKNIPKNFFSWKTKKYILQNSFKK